MNENRIGINVDDLRLPAKDGIRVAAELGCGAIELPVAFGETAPNQLSASGRRHLSRFVSGFGLRLPALSADVPGLRLTDPKNVAERIDRTCQVIELAADMKVPVVTAAAGAICHPESGALSPLAADALRQIGAFADARRVQYALRPSYDAPRHIHAAMQSLNCPWLRIGIDPAALIMSGIDPLMSLEFLADAAVHFHVRDALAGLPDRPGREMGLGDGDVDWRGLIELLEGIGYGGAYIVRQSDAERPQIELSSSFHKLKSSL